MKHYISILGIAIMAMLVMGRSASAQGQTTSPNVISYQGMLSSGDGTPIPDGEYQITVTLYGDEYGSASVWQDTYDIMVQGGVFSLYLGSGRVPLPAPGQMDKALWVGARLSGGDELRPLTRLSATPYALNVPDKAITSHKLADGAVTKEKVNMDYVEGVSINGEKVQGKGTVLKIQAGKDIDVSYDETTQSVVIGAAAGKGINSDEKNGDRKLQGSALDAWTMRGEGITVATGAPAAATASDYIGTNAPGNIVFNIRANGQPAMTFQPNGTNTPSIIGGNGSNSAPGGGRGNTISGGGAATAATANTIEGLLYNSIGGGEGNKILNTSSSHSTISGGLGNTIGSNVQATSQGSIGGGSANQVLATSGTVGGGQNNIIGSGSSGGTVAGGRGNAVNSTLGTVGGGIGNQANGNTSTIGGGSGNATTNDLDVVGGGISNIVSGPMSGVFSGESNFVNQQHSAIVGGIENRIDGGASFIGGGNRNSITNGNNSVVGGGTENHVDGYASGIFTGSINSTVGDHNVVATGVGNQIDGMFSFIGSGDSHVSRGEYNLIGDGRNNQIRGSFNLISHGAFNVIGSKFSAIIQGNSNEIYGYTSLIGNGESNIISTDYSVIGNGRANQNDVPFGFIGTGQGNGVANGEFSTVVNGRDNNVNGSFNFLGTGEANIMKARYSLIGGGRFNSLTGYAVVIDGGESNAASADLSTVGGGANNTILSTATYAAIGGGIGNRAINNGLAGAIPGGDFLTVQSYGQAAVGVWNAPRGNIVFRDGTMRSSHEPIFMVGNGIAGTRRNAFEVSYSGHSTVTGEAGQGNPVVTGGTYTDNVTYAWGDVGWNGVAVVRNGDFGVSSITRMGAGWYRIRVTLTLPATAVTPVNLTAASITANVSTNVPPGGMFSKCKYVTVSRINTTNNEFDIFITEQRFNAGTMTLDCVNVDESFMFRVSGRPPLLP